MALAIFLTGVLLRECALSSRPPSFGCHQIPPCVPSFGFESQEPWSVFTSRRARKRDPKTFSLTAHNQELVLRHVTLFFEQLFQISLKRGLCFNHCIERLFDVGRQIICINVLPFQFFPSHCLAPNVGCHTYRSVAFSPIPVNSEEDRHRHRCCRPILGAPMPTRGNLDWLLRNR